jgi:hypothetical protein
MRFAVVLAMAAALGAGCVSAPEADPLLRSDPHVAQLFNVLRATRAAGEPVDMDKLDAQLRDMGRAHAIEWEIDQAPAERMILRTGHKAWADAKQKPEILNSLDAFNRAIGAW